LKLLLYSRFYPSIGGIETVASILAHEWVSAGHQVSVIADNPPGAAPERSFPFEVFYQPSAGKFLQLVRDHEVFVHCNVNLRGLWPCLLIRRPVVFTHHNDYLDAGGKTNWRQNLKLFIARNARLNIAVSHAVAAAVGTECQVIPNPYNTQIFRQQDNKERPRQLVFVGRLVSDKGMEFFLEALRLMKAKGIEPDLTVIGEGPERVRLERLVQEWNLDRVRFLGSKPPVEVAALLSEHRIMVVPSLFREPFGVVALEGIACGCVVAGSSGGGLSDAIGPCGLTFPNGESKALAGILERLLGDTELMNSLRTHAAEHLARHEPRRIAARYLELLQAVIGK